MDSSKGSGKAEPRQQAQPSYEPFQPPSGWSQDKEKHTLLVHLPGFNKEDIRVQVDNSGKLTVTGTKKVGEGRYMRVEETYQVPKTCSTEKISGTFEDGLLKLIMPKVVPDKEEPQKTIPSDEKKKAVQEKEAPQKMIPTKDEEKKAVQEKEAPKKTIPSEEEKKKAVEEKEAPQKMIPSADEKKKEVEEKGATRKLIPSENEKKKELKEKEAPQKMIHEKKKEVEESKKEKEPVHKKRKNREDEGFFKTRIRKGKEGKWSDYELVDNLLEKINKNRKVIVVAVVAFSVGFYVSHKLRSSGR